MPTPAGARLPNPLFTLEAGGLLLERISAGRSRLVLELQHPELESVGGARFQLDLDLERGDFEVVELGLP